MSRIIALIDMDCFYAQIEQRLKPELWGRPVAVSQIGAGGECLQFHMRLVPSVLNGNFAFDDKDFSMKWYVTKRSETSLSFIRGIYRAASDEVFDVLSKQPHIVLEKASVDEAYLDITEAVESELYSEGADEIIGQYMDNVDKLFPSSYVADGEDENIESNQRIARILKWLNEECRVDHIQLKLAIGACLIEKIRTEIFEKTQFRCSAGIGINKVIAKLACARHKPNQQTIIPPQYVTRVYETTPISSVRNLGGKLGKALTDKFGIKTMADLSMVPKEQVLHEFPENAEWLFKIMQGNDDEPIRPRLQQKSLAVSKNFPGKYQLRTVSGIERWINNLSTEFSKRLYEDQVVNRRTAQNLTISFNTEDGTNSKTVPLNSYSSLGIINNLLSFMRPFNKSEDRETWYPPIRHINMSASRFRNGVDVQIKRITEWTQKGLQREFDSRSNEMNLIEKDKPKHFETFDQIIAVEKTTGFYEDDHQPSTSTRVCGDDLIVLDSDSDKGDYLTDENSKDSKRFARANRKMGNLQDNMPLSERTALMSQYMPTLEDLEGIKDVLDELPDDIKEEIMHYAKVQDARDMKARRNKPKIEPSKRGKRKSQSESHKANKKIDEFFLKSKSSKFE